MDKDKLNRMSLKNISGIYRIFNNKNQELLHRIF